MELPHSSPLPDDDSEALFAAAREGAALCTVVGIEGSWSRRLGAQLAVLPDGTSVVAAALVENNVPFAMTVVARGTDLTQRDGRGWQLVHVAAASGNADLVKMVLSKGVDPNTMTQPPPSASPQPALNAAPAAGGGGQPPKKRALEAAEYLLPPPPAPTPPLLIAARAGSIEAMKVLIAAGAKPDAKAEDGLTLPLAAAGSGNLEALKYALALVPDINALSQGGKSIMHMALANRTAPPADTEAIVTYLADKGAALNIKDEHNIAPGDYINRVGPEEVRVFYKQMLKDRGVTASTAH